MTDPRKLIDDEPDELTRNLLSSALDDDPSPRALQRTAAALGLAGIATGTAKAAGAAAGAKTGLKLGGSLALKWFGVGAAAGLLVAGGTHLAQQRSQQPARLQPVAASVAPAIEARVEAVRATPEARPSELAEPLAEPARNEPAPSAPSSNDARSPAKTPPIAAEIAALDRARVALRKNDPASALATIDELERAGANAPGASALGPEASVIRVEALLARGDKAKAVALAKRFIAQNPSSPHVSRMREIARSSE